MLSLVIASFLFTFADFDASALSKRSGRQFTQMDVCVPRGNVESDGTQTMCVECNARTTLPADRYEKQSLFSRFALSSKKKLFCNTKSNNSSIPPCKQSEK